MKSKENNYWMPLEYTYEAHFIDNQKKVDLQEQ
jgi:hypothetical protein